MYENDWSGRRRTIRERQRNEGLRSTGDLFFSTLDVCGRPPTALTQLLGGAGLGRERCGVVFFSQPAGAMARSHQLLKHQPNAAGAPITEHGEPTESPITRSAFSVRSSVPHAQGLDEPFEGDRSETTFALLGDLRCIVRGKSSCRRRATTMFHLFSSFDHFPQAINCILTTSAAIDMGQRPCQSRSASKNANVRISRTKAYEGVGGI